MLEQPSDNSKTISRSSIAFLGGTFLSRLTGLGRDIAMAFCFGSNPAIAAFMVAFRFANLIRRLFGEGPLQSGFIPHFEQIRSTSPQKGAEFFRDLFFSLAIFLLGLIAVAEIGLIVIWKWGHLSPDNAQILYLTLLMLPGVLFICLFGLSSGLLQCERRFFLTGFAPAAFNAVWMVAAWQQRDQEASLAAVALSGAIVVAFLMQWAVVAPRTFEFLRRFLSWKNCFKFQLFSEEMRQVVKPFLLGIVGVGAVQINSALDAVFARYASLEGPAYLWYAIRIEQLPLALFGIALSSALLPPLARAIKDNLFEHYHRLIRFAYRRSFSLIFPCTMGIFVLGACGVNLLYGHGDFDSQTTYHTVICLWGYGLGLVPSVLVLLLAPAFYAKKDYRTPTLGSVYSVILNTVATAFFVFGLGWGAFSIAVATSLCAWVNYFYLSYHLAKRMGSVWDKQVVFSYFKTGLCTLIAGGTTLLVGWYLTSDPTVPMLWGDPAPVFARNFTDQLLQFLVLTGTFSTLFFSYAWLLNAHDILELVGLRRGNDETKSEESLET
jgi:putative peptidoglycan lipid II flippase